LSADVVSSCFRFAYVDAYACPCAELVHVVKKYIQVQPAFRYPSGVISETGIVGYNSATMLDPTTIDLYFRKTKRFTNEIEIED